VKSLSPTLPKQAQKTSETVGKFLVQSNGSAHVNGETDKSCVRLSKAKSETSSLQEIIPIVEKELWKVKLANRAKSFWYPYAILRNVIVLERLLRNAGVNLLELCRGEYGRVADVGAADGDLAFLLDQMGFSVDLIDNEYTNFNNLEGARILKEALNSSVTIRSADLDSRSQLFTERYDAVFLLGILYHLKNPFFILERLARVARYCFLSTRIARQTADGSPLSRYPVAYLLGPEECNNDSTNFWIFSDEGLKRLIHRTGWSILAFTTIGDTKNSTPADRNHDERALCVLKSDAVSGLTAFPNPLPLGESLGKTTIQWSTADACPAKIYVSIDGQEESLFAAGCKGIAVADWIEPGRIYEFRLYDSDRTRLLDKIKVTTTTK
jgi:2-polyprenyl-3-methyl-5-hydroxy-6-metoxy-1,4-benzoquinol methylase